MKKREKRGFIRLNLLSLAFTIGGIVALLLMVGAVVAFPLALDHLGLAPDSRVIVSLARWPLMFAGLLAALGILYRFGPSRRAAAMGMARHRHAGRRLLWIAGSSLLSWYLSNFGNYSATYGSLGAAIGLMTWMWMSAIIVLFGAELNSEIEHQTAADTTVGIPKPLGARGAPWPIRRPLGSGRAKRTLAKRINIDAKVTALGGAQTRPCLKISVFSRVGAVRT